MFPRVVFDLPHDKEDARYEELTQQARENLEREKSNLSEKSVDDVPFGALANVSTVRKKCIQYPMEKRLPSVSTFLQHFPIKSLITFFN